jgi:hypothetical protein
VNDPSNTPDEFGTEASRHLCPPVANQRRIANRQPPRAVRPQRGELFGMNGRHSPSDRVDVRLARADDETHAEIVEINDWGIGFGPAGVTENRFGLGGIRKRARLLRGRAVIDSAPGEGTRIFVDLPVAYALDEVPSADSWSNA